eukprot:COSAG03_NODE_81_length_14000_cov_112.534206_14_plen_108_part_00
MTGGASHPQCQAVGSSATLGAAGRSVDGAGRKGEKGDRGSSRCRRSRCRRSRCSLDGSASLWTLRQQDAPPRAPVQMTISAQCNLQASLSIQESRPIPSGSAAIRGP